uniref:Mediator of RNA polymerase II transcription subunit 10 n=1 Tax=Globisporangium ultimum (strain ATCC 200006 / CBS 805.95 / DAOM BR144) TaxID=431595 RepID=K3W9N9_GLOUD
METEKVLDEEEEEEKEHFFADLVPSDRDHDDHEEEEEEDDVGVREPLHSAPPSSSESGSAVVATTEQDRRAQIGASPYLAPFTPLSSPSRPKTPSSTSAAQRSATKKPQLVPMKNGPAGAFGASSSSSGGTANSSKVLKDDVVAHLPNELVESLMATVQTLDKLILGVEDYKADQLGFLYDKVNAYVELLKQIDTAGANYHALIPLQVLAMVDGQENTNPELFTKAQLEKCLDESERAASKVDTLVLLKEALESGISDL